MQPITSVLCFNTNTSFINEEFEAKKYLVLITTKNSI